VLGRLPVEGFPPVLPGRCAAMARQKTKIDAKTSRMRAERVISVPLFPVPETLA